MIWWELQLSMSSKSYPWLPLASPCILLFSWFSLSPSSLIKVIHKFNLMLYLASVQKVWQTENWAWKLLDMWILFNLWIHAYAFFSRSSTPFGFLSCAFQPLDPSPLKQLLPRFLPIPILFVSIFSFFPFMKI